MHPLLEQTVPLLSVEQTRELETRLFGGDSDADWAAIQRAGRAVATALRADAAEIGGLPPHARLLVLVGKGHNGADALIATGELLRCLPAATADLVFVFGERSLRPLSARAWQQLQQEHGSGEASRVRTVSTAALLAPPAEFAVCLDGIFGFQFRPPAPDVVRTLLEQVNRLPVAMRVAVDVPSARLFRADFTYATGVVKTESLADKNSGRIRYLDLGFFRERQETACAQRGLTTELLRPLAGWRAPDSDKRTFGHVVVMGGSRSYPGAVMMTVRAALHAGAGLVTALVPESLAPSYAAQVPEAMWVGWPETPGGGLALEGMHLLRERLERATALVIGPGLAREPETLVLLQQVVAAARVPVLLDADALQSEIIRAAKTPLLLTPHAGEFKRIAGDARLEDFAARVGATVVLKGPITRVASPAARASAPGDPLAVFHSFHGGPVLARGGSGDILAGLIGGLLAQTPQDPVLAAARGVVWHGWAADLLARGHGQVAVRTTQLLDFLGPALRGVR